MNGIIPYSPHSGTQLRHTPRFSSLKVVALAMVRIISVVKMEKMPELGLLILG